MVDDDGNDDGVLPNDGDDVTLFLQLLFVAAAPALVVLAAPVP